MDISMIERIDFLERVAAARTNEIVVTTMTATLQWPTFSNSDLDFDFLAFGMGHASDFALGLAIARPERRTIVFKGDGGLLMSLGSLVTLAEYAPENLVLFLLENRSYEMTGGQPLPSRADFGGLARSSGIDGCGPSGTGKVLTWNSLDAVESGLPSALADPGPHFIVVPVTNSVPLPATSHTDHAGRVKRLRSGLGIG
jgi:thiamine pyrophosphate-dependent acetolactate synthase large subunit-like protein